MRGLLYKEFLQARPPLVSAVIIGLLLVVSDLLGAEGLVGVSGLLTIGVEGWLLLTGALAFALGHAQIGPEVSHGHVELLDGLPVNRIQIYFAKLGAGFSVVLGLVTVTAIGKVAMTQLAWGTSATSTLVTVIGALAVGLFAFYATGLVLSWFGGFGWVLLIVGLTVLSTLAELVETVRPMSIFHGYGTVRFEANEPIVLLWPLAAWSIHGGLCVATSGALFVGRGDRLVAAESGISSAVKAILVVGIGALVGLGGTVTALRLAARGADAGRRPVVVDASGFRVLVPEGAPAAAQALIDRIPVIDAGVRALLGASAPVRVDVELAGGGRFHAGLYTGGKIRMALGENASAIFAHELAHAYVDAITGRVIRRHHDALRFFNEGLAMWAAEHVVGQKDETEAHRAWAGALYALEQHHIDALMSDRARSLRYDPFEPYPLGLVFVESLVEVEGARGPRCILRALGTLPQVKLTGVALWGRMVEACALDLTKINDAYEDRLRTYAARWPLPPEDAMAQPVWSGGRLVLKLAPLPDDVDPMSLQRSQRRRCRFRSRIEVTPADLDESTEGSNNECPVRAIISATDTVSFQVGVRLEGGWTAYGPWVQQPVPLRPAKSVAADFE